MLSGGYGRYENWGLRAAITPSPGKVPAKELKPILGDSGVYLRETRQVCHGWRKREGRPLECVEVPKHGVELTQGFYLGKYEVTQSQYMAAMGQNPSRSIGSGIVRSITSEPDAQQFGFMRNMEDGFLPRRSGNTPAAQGVPVSGSLVKIE